MRIIGTNLNDQAKLKSYFCVMQDKRIFQFSIGKEQIDDLPLRAYEGEIVLIEDQESLDLHLPDLLNESILGFDTETRPAFKKGVYYQTSLLQLATAHKVYLIRLQTTGLPMSLTKLFSDRDKLKIGIACLDDLKDLNRLNKFFSHSVIDLNRACPKVGFESIGAKKLSALVLGFKISKRQQTSNWEAPELTEAQLKYAATDAWICREIYLKLKQAGKKLQVTIP